MTRYVALSTFMVSLLVSVGFALGTVIALLFGREPSFSEWAMASSLLLALGSFLWLILDEE